MRKMPKTLRDTMALDPFMKHCIYDNCIRAPEWEHAWIYAGRQINEAWAIVPVCPFHHRGAGLDKAYNQYVSLMRATDEELNIYPRVNWEQKKKYLKKKYE